MVLKNFSIVHVCDILWHLKLKQFVKYLKSKTLCSSEVPTLYRPPWLSHTHTSACSPWRMVPKGSASTYHLIAGNNCWWFLTWPPGTCCCQTTQRCEGDYLWGHLWPGRTCGSGPAADTFWMIGRFLDSHSAKKTLDLYRLHIAKTISVTPS